MSASRSLLPLPALLAATIVVAPAATRAQEPPVTLTPYTVRAGDGCERIAKRVYGDPAKYALIHAHNPQLGPMPHRLRPGTVLMLPPDPAAVPDAMLTRASGTVETRRPERTTWESAQTGLGLFRAWRVASRERASADVTFRDASLLQMRENTVVVIYGASAQGTRVAKAEARLESGELRSRMGELSGKRVPTAGLVVSTDDAQAEVGSGTAVLSARTDGTRVANHGGAPLKLRGRSREGRVRGKAIAVASGMGSTAERGKDPTPPRPLPPPPSWVKGPATLVAADGARGELVAAWEPAKGAKEYLVELSRDERGLDVVARAVVPGTIRRFESKELPLGAYWLTVSTIDAESIEGMPSSALPLELIALAVVPSRGATAPFAGSAMVGARIEAAAGMQCRIGDGAPASSVVVTAPGDTTLRCVDAAGMELPPTPLKAAPLPVRFASARGAPTLVRGAAAEVALRAPPELARDLRVVVGAGATVGAPRVAGDGTVSFPIQVAADAPATLAIDAVFSSASGDLTVASQVATVVEPARVTKPPRLGEIGLFVGASDFDRGFTFGDAAAPDWAVFAGVRLTVPFGAWLAAEGYFAYGRANYDAAVLLDDSGRLLGAGASLLLHLSRGRVRPFVAGGIDLQRVILGDPGSSGDRARVSAAFRAGLTLDLGSAAGLRVDLVDRLSDGLSGARGAELGAYLAF